MTPIALAWGQYRLERKLLWRNPTAAFFSLVLPLMMLVLVASVFAGESEELDVLIPGIAGMGVMATTFTALAYNLTYRRQEGILKRVRGTPMPPASFVGGVLASAVVNAFAQVALVVAIGHLLYGVEWPQSPLELTGFTVLGVVCFGALGIAFSLAIPNTDSAPAYVNAVFLPLIFISGVFYSADSLPAALTAVAEALPLKHLIDGLAGAIVGASVDAASAAAVLGLWAAAGIALSLRFFRWS